MNGRSEKCLFQVASLLSKKTSKVIIQLNEL